MKCADEQKGSRELEIPFYGAPGDFLVGCYPSFSILVSTWLFDDFKIIAELSAKVTMPLIN
jgi:hypothetical protein